MAVDMFLKIEGIEGESSDDHHKGEIEIQSFSWGVSQTSIGHTGGGMGSGKVSMQDLHFVTSIDKSSPLLMKAACTGEHFKKATLTVRKSGGDQQQDYLTYKLTDVLVSGFKAGGSSDEIPLEEVSLNFNKIEFSYLGRESITADCSSR